MADANDLRAHLERLDAEGRLVRVTRPINKNTELHPLVRWQFRSDLPEAERKGFLFENVVDSSGRRYPYPVAVGVLASNPAIYAMGMQCELSEVPARWEQALSNPIEAVLVDDGPVHEVVITGDALDVAGEGLDSIPVPISTPGFDNAPYSTCSHWITKDIVTGIRNVGKPNDGHT